MLSTLANVTLRCRGHENSAPNCAQCRWLKDFEEDLRLVRVHRANLMADLEKKLGTREIIIVGVK